MLRISIRGISGARDVSYMYRYVDPLAGRQGAHLG